MSRGKGKGPRWWPMLILWPIIIAFVILLEVAGEAISLQPQFHRALSVVIGLFLTLCWLLFFSRIPWRMRLGALAGCAVFVVLLNAAFEIHPSGDMVPQFRPRWQSTETVKTRSQTEETTAAVAAYPQFQGPNRDAKLTDIHLDRAWDTHPPELLWRQPIDPAWSAFSIQGNLAVTQVQRGESECVIALDLATGKEAWSHCEAGRHATPIGGTGPRATPTIHGDRVLAMGCLGNLVCLQLADGKKIWSRQVFQELGTQPPEWGSSASPLVVDDRVVVSLGIGDAGTLAAYELDDGGPVWTASGDSSAFSSPALLQLDGVDQLVMFAQKMVYGFDPATGGTLWSFPWPTFQPTVSIPITIDATHLLVSSGYGIGASLLQLSRENDQWQATEVWHNRFLKSKFAVMIEHEGFVYGIDEGIMVCIDPNTGERRWKGGRYGHGQMLLVGDLLLVSSEKGELVLIDPKPEALTELHRVKALNGKSWNPPSLAGDLLLVRNAREAACFRVKLRENPSGEAGTETPEQPAEPQPTSAEEQQPNDSESSGG
ncbi:PQQ-binding-like beta-propeller repeat protein [Sulfidibacter corallicola]|uniref:PQQ-binding-like beta-propeller repeat protein n=1 Tax=Sulfidibacter corallicola TaxID=2818388 RepID=A0A8A4TR67_SULCO|nr:PQQ-binding-like beta-propeller repeat protein [Sulfidibacter corallicola]QTD52040.1 PQQ-binding-like beta-propeller repeat protein [Sulfidibacter corallicola]